MYNLSIRYMYSVCKEMVQEGTGGGGMVVSMLACSGTCRLSVLVSCSETLVYLYLVLF